jgi:serine/threonine protein kinase/tetratricopeptide (TPR) repeat protein
VSDPESDRLHEAFAELRPPVDAELARARAHAHRALFGALADSEAEGAARLVVGRYRLLANVGRGGLGDVWAAHDPQLDRVVAVKLLRDHALRRHRRARAQLLAEAALMARLTHPNVVRVYDVGEHEGELFVAMEYVEGRTLRGWQLDARGREWRALLDVYLRAGEGLAAAHAAGLVHGDFKPDNVLIGHDGRVLVSDFAVASHVLAARLDADESDGGAAEPRAPLESGATLLDSSVDEQVALIGTPAYMAPEQLEGRRADARSDQFAFCVCLWEALMGTRPFGGATPDELRAAIRSGPLEPSRRIPAVLLATLRRGLAHAPEQRHADMAGLLARLRALRARRRRVALVATFTLLAAASLAGVAYGLANQTRPHPPQCSLEPTLAWDAARRAELGEQLQRSPSDTRGLAPEQVEIGLRALDEFAQAWTDTRTLACALARREGEPGRARHDARVSCLLAARDELDATLALVSAPEFDASIAGQPLLASLSDPHRCMGVATPRRRDEEPTRAGELADLRREVAQVRAMRLGQQHEAALRRCLSLRAGATRLDDAATLAALELEHGVLLRHLGQPRDGMRQLQRAVSLAARASARELELDATHEVAATAMLIESDPRELEAWAERTVMLAERVGDPLTAMRGQLLLGRAALLLGRPAEALAIQTAALARGRRELEPDSPELAYAHDFLGGTEAELGHVEAALAHKREAIAILEGAYGPDHLDLVTLLGTAANVHAIVGRRREAEALFERALTIASAALGREHRRTRSVARRYADFLFDEGRPDEAEALLVGDDSPWVTLARAEWALEQGELARAHELADTLEQQPARDDPRLLAAGLELRARIALGEDARERVEMMAEGLEVLGRARGTSEHELVVLELRAELELREQGRLTPASRERLDAALARPGVHPRRALRALLVLLRDADASARARLRPRIEQALAGALGPAHPHALRVRSELR